MREVRERYVGLLEYFVVGVFIMGVIRCFTRIIGNIWGIKKY